MIGNPKGTTLVLKIEKVVTKEVIITEVEVILNKNTTAIKEGTIIEVGIQKLE